ncbi:DUF817 domain-containing protein [Streptomyces sp. WMMC500]|uniref:DUF817 domain-containing protein n=1 Tax=Streptomyces sp. WMMC500 TaxID=3015154 RepID=UPI00248D3A49|nr:DUF817 domain-containing protein [Streptomyces sp. WMMC500]WBB64381.1 DUF817 domain-containing protein [Streptomyces sp. WMMC500]
MGQLWYFGGIQLRCCAFAAAVLAGVALSGQMPRLPVARYDLLLLYGLLLTALFWARGWETGRELAVIAVCHAIGLAFELLKVSLGSWSYPEPALLKFGGVPLYGGFLYAAVGSYVCRAWRLFDLGLVRYRARITELTAAAIYVNFFTHHWLPDARWLLAGVLLVVTWGTWVEFTVHGRRHRMPLALSFVLIGFFLWLAENIATRLGAWRYPYQAAGWQPVGIDKFAAWSLLITVTFVLVARTRQVRTRAQAPADGRRPPRRVRP